MLKWLLAALWGLLQALLALWFGVVLPDLDLQVLAIPAEPEEVVAVSLDGGWEELRDGWDEASGLEALPDRPLPSLVPEPTLEEARRDALIDELETVGLLAMLGTTGSIEGLFADVDGAGLDDALGGLSGDAASVLTGAADQDVFGGLIGHAPEAGLGARGGGLGGGGTGEGTIGLGGIGVIGRGSGATGSGYGSGGIATHRGESPRVVRRAEVAWPDDGGAHRCAVVIRVDVGGRGTVERFTRCDEGYRALVEAAVASSTFAPAERADGPIEATFTTVWR